MIWRNVGFFFALFIILLSSFLVQYSVSVSNNLLIFNKHIFFFIFCIPVSLLIILMPIEKIIFVNKFVYYINLLVLFGTLIIGKTSMGATRWLNLGGLTFQPSEFMKISIILILGSYFHKANEINIKKLSYFFIPIVYFSLPVLLILLQRLFLTS
jgi:rod shape determining protein RodA